MMERSAQVSVSSDELVSLRVKLPVGKLDAHLTTLASLGGVSARVLLRGEPKKVASLIASLSGRYPSVSAQVSIGDRAKHQGSAGASRSVAVGLGGLKAGDTGLSGAKPVK